MIHFMPVSKEPLPDVSLVNEKYQTAQAAATINYAQPMIKEFTQSAPNK